MSQKNYGGPSLSNSKNVKMSILQWLRLKLKRGNGDEVEVVVQGGRDLFHAVVTLGFLAFCVALVYLLAK